MCDSVQMLAVLLVMLSSAIVRGFLLDAYTCQVPDPCTCMPDRLLCGATGLTAFPDFNATQLFADRRLDIFIDSNSINIIPDGALALIGTSNATEINMYIQNNNISRIDNNAFAGVENELKLLDLTNNNLKTVPMALKSLENLQTLLLKGNPLTSLSSSAIFSVSRTLNTLSLSLDQFQQWPSELHYFRRLSTLSVDGFQQSRLPLNALSGVEATLTTLEISHSRLDRLPAVICHLDNLRHLDFVSNPDSRTPLFEPCNHNITSVHFLNLRDNNLEQFPDVLSSFTALGFLDLSDNHIRVVDSDAIPPDASLTHLNLSGNSLHRVPTAINKLSNLRSLYLDNNKIFSLEDFDLQSLNHLRTINLSMNPLEYLSKGAFYNQAALDSLYLQFTKLNTIPEAVVSLASINNLDMTGTPVECTCAMSYLNAWHGNASTMMGTCEGTGESLGEFVHQFLPLCP